eukprot:764137-Hanusia_phi.AAC.4
MERWRSRGRMQSGGHDRRREDGDHNFWGAMEGNERKTANEQQLKFLSSPPTPSSVLTISHILRRSDMLT